MMMMRSRFEEKPTSQKSPFLHLILYNVGLGIFQKSYLVQIMRPIALYNHTKHSGRSLEPFWRKKHYMGGKT